jgi:hypothetical protein
MFWLAVICGGLLVLHAFLLIILKFRKRNSEKPGIYGALVFPRFEIFLLFLALPGICKASSGLIKGNLIRHYYFYKAPTQTQTPNTRLTHKHW